MHLTTLLKTEGRNESKEKRSRKVKIKEVSWKKFTLEKQLMKNHWVEK